jgi:hypothetical protein
VDERAKVPLLGSVLLSSSHLDVGRRESPQQPQHPFPHPPDGVSDLVGVSELLSVFQGLLRVVKALRRALYRRRGPIPTRMWLGGPDSCGPVVRFRIFWSLLEPPHSL